MPKLLLDNLRIRNYRPFQQLTIERLGRVNLIVGKNNVGKTALLEALWLYASQGDPAVILELLKSRDEFAVLSRGGVKAGAEEWFWSLRSLFHGRPAPGNDGCRLNIGPFNSSVADLSLKFSIGSDLGDITLLGKPLFTVGSSDGAVDLYLLERNVGSFFRLRTDDTYETRLQLDYLFITSDGLDEREIGGLRDNAVLRGRSDLILKALRLIEPRVKEIDFIASPAIDLGEKDHVGERIAVIRLDHLSYPVPLRSRGEGLNRLLGIALALVNTKDGILLIDEIESGLHYSVQPDMWRLVFETAARLNVQVFATTHSWDCIEAFQEAAEAHPEEGVLVSLRRKQHEDGIAAVLFDERDLKSVARSYIEVR